MSGLAFLLPHLEQQPLYAAINTDFVHVESGEYPTLENRTARNTTVAVFLCPSDGEPNHLNSYRFNRGRFGMRGRPFDGPFSLGVPPSPAAITDGLARTAFLSERIGGSFAPGAGGPPRDIHLPEVGNVFVDSDTQYVPLCLAAPPGPWVVTAGRYWLFNGMFYSDYNHNGGPNDPRPSCGGGIHGDLGLHPPRSYHAGIVHVVFGDGHTEAVADSIDPRAWTALGTHDAGD